MEKICNISVEKQPFLRREAKSKAAIQLARVHIRTTEGIPMKELMGYTLVENE